MSIPLNFISGFFGSGKTTFLKKYLQECSNDRKIAVIQNEFSTVGIDGIEISQDDTYDILEINNGSVFCVCLLGSFINSLNAFIEEVKPAELIMETSGMSDPIGIAEMLQSPKLKGRVHAGYFWTVVDVLNFYRKNPLRNRLENQVRIADTIVLNKVDLFTGDLQTLTEKIKLINPFASIIPASYCKIDFTAKNQGIGIFPQQKISNNQRPLLDTLVIKTHKKVNKLLLKNFLASFANNIIRCKGYMHSDENKLLHIQGVFDKWDIKEMDNENIPAEFIIIGNIKDQSYLKSAFFKQCFV